MSYGSLFFDKTQMNGNYCVDILIPLFHCYMRYAIDSCKLQKKLGWEPSRQFEEGIEETVKWYLENQEWMDHVTSGDYEGMYKNR